MTALWNLMKGKKAYTIAIGMVLYAVLGVLIGQHDYNTAIELITEAALGGAIRHGVG